MADQTKQFQFSLTEEGRKKRYHLEKRYFTDPLSFGSFQVYQIGRLFCTESTIIPMHAHKGAFELTVVTDGRGLVYTGEVAVPVEAGDIFLSFPYDFHGITTDPKEPLKYDFLCFKTLDARESADFEEIMQRFMPAEQRIIRDETVSALVAEAIGEVDSDRRYSDKLLEGIFSQITVRLICDFLDSPFGSAVAVSDHQALCYRLMNYIDTHVYTMTGLEELSELTNYNYSYLSSLFRRVTAGTLAEYYRNRRLETARLLILEGDRSITQIAEQLNYSSIYTFSRAFKDRYGISPEQYRRTAKQPLSPS